MPQPDDAPLALWPPLLALQTTGDRSKGHAHHTLHLVIAREGTLTVEIDGRVHEAAGVLTPPDLPHAIDAGDRTVVLLFIDPEGREGARLARMPSAPETRDAWATGAYLVDSCARDALLEGLPTTPGRADLQAWARRALDRLAPTEDAVSPKMHPRIRRLLAGLREELEHGREIDFSLDALAARAELSSSRFMHVFTESVGIPLRPYVRWLRIQRAAASILTGRTLATAAADAGFSDGAHLSRSFRSMFGMPPSVLRGREEMIRADATTPG